MEFKMLHKCNVNGVKMNFWFMLDATNIIVKTYCRPLLQEIEIEMADKGVYAPIPFTSSVCNDFIQNNLPLLNRLYRKALRKVSDS